MSVSTDFLGLHKHTHTAFQTLTMYHQIFLCTPFTTFSWPFIRIDTDTRHRRQRFKLKISTHTSSIVTPHKTCSTRHKLAWEWNFVRLLRAISSAEKQMYHMLHGYSWYTICSTATVWRLTCCHQWTLNWVFLDFADGWFIAINIATGLAVMDMPISWQNSNLSMPMSQNIISNKSLLSV